MDEFSAVTQSTNLNDFKGGISIRDDVSNILGELPLIASHDLERDAVHAENLSAGLKMPTGRRMPRAVFSMLQAYTHSRNMNSPISRRSKALSQPSALQSA